jgi:FkbM family methyltransferase
MKGLKRFLRKLGRKIGRYVPSGRENEFGQSGFSDMKQFLRNCPAPVILDVGGHVGDSAALFKEAFPSSVIHSFEPSPQNFRKLKANVEGKRDVFAWNHAIGATAEKKALFENENTGMSSFFELGEFGWGKIERQVAVDVTTLDSFVALNQIDRIDILKSDTQGYELEVLQGAERMLGGNRIGLIYLELIFSPMYKGLPPVYRIFQHLTDRGFELVSIYGMHYQHNLADWADALFVNKLYFAQSTG